MVCKLVVQYSLTNQPSIISTMISSLIILQLKQQQMGNTKSQKVTNCQQHERLGQVRLTESVDPQGNRVEEMIITRSIESQRVFNEWVKQLNKINDGLANQVLLLPNKTVFQSTGMCGSNGLVTLKYQHYPYVFQKEVENRRKIGRFFLETQLWYLLYNMVRAGSKFQKNHLKIGDVHPNSILINDDGLVKLISTHSFPGELNNYQKFMENAHEKVYLAPQQLQHTLGRHEYPKNVDPSVAQCYCIGLVMLTAATLEDVDSVYVNSGEERSLQRHKVNYYLKIFGEKYSSSLHSTVMGLLADNPVHRKRSSQIYSSLYPYQTKILDLEPFSQNSRLLPSQQYPMASSQSRESNIQPQNRVNYVVSGQSRPVSKMFYSHNGVVVNPIQSKYVPMAQYQSIQQTHLNPRMVSHQQPVSSAIREVPRQGIVQSRSSYPSQPGYYRN